MEILDLWSQLARLEEHCAVRIEPVQRPGTPPTRVWRLSIVPKDGSAAIVMESEKALEAIVRGLAAAKTAGWGSKEPTANA